MKLSRLRDAEWLTAAAVAVVVVSLFGVHWYPGRTGWESATNLRWLLLLAAAVGAALVITQAAFRAPAIPVSLDVIGTVLAALTLLWLLVRVVVDPGSHEQLGAWLGLIGGVGLEVGSFLAMRREGIRDADGPGEVPLVDPVPTHPPAAGE